MAYEVVRKKAFDSEPGASLAWHFFNTKTDVDPSPAVGLNQKDAPYGLGGLSA